MRKRTGKPDRGLDRLNDHAPTGAGACRIETGPSVQCGLCLTRLGRRFALFPPRAAEDSEARKTQGQQQGRARLGHHREDGE